MMPSDSPLAMPVMEIHIDLTLEKNWRPTGRQGSTSTTSLRGAIGRVAESFEDMKVVRELLQHTSDLPPSVVLWGPRLSLADPNRALNSTTSIISKTLVLRVVLIGTLATAIHAQVIEAIRRAGEPRFGLGDSTSNRIPFTIQSQVHFAGFMGGRLGEVAPDTASIEFIPPFYFEPPKQDPTQPSRKLAIAEESSIATLAAKSAQLLARLATLQGFRGRAPLDDLIGLVREDFRGVSEQKISDTWQHIDLGLRRSSTNHHMFPVQGLVGCTLLRGSLAPAWPWLSLMSLWGVGRRKSMGFGETLVNALSS